MPSSVILTLTSNGSLDMYPNNQRNNFTNVPPRNFIDNMLKPVNRKIYMRIRSISLSSRLEDGADPVNSRFVSVHLSQVEPQIHNRTYGRSITRFYLKDSDKEYETVNFEHSPFLPIQSTPISSLTISLITATGESLQLKPGYPTFVVLELSTMDFSREFTINCNSHAYSLFPDNSIAKFKVAMPEEMDLDGWEVCLLNASLPPNIKRSFRVTFSMWEGQLQKPNQTNREDYHFNLFNFLDAEPQDLLRAIGLTIDASAHYKSKLGLEIEQDVNHPDCGLPTLTNSSKDVIFVKLSKSLSGLLKGKRQEEPETFEFPPTARHTIRWEGSGPVQSGAVHSFLPSPLALVHCDIIESSAVGSQLAPLLHLMPLPHFDRHGQQREHPLIYEPQHLIFHKVRNMRFSNIEFTINQPDGKLQYFELDGGLELGTNITLLFRPINRGSTTENTCNLQIGRC